MTRRIYLFRHGETEWNVAGKMQGRLDSPLTEHGRQQAKAHGRLLAGLSSPDCLWVSSAGRTRATAELLNAAVQVPMHFSDALVERDCGTWSGKTAAQVRTEHAAEWAQLQQDGFRYRPGGGENLPDLMQRFRDLLAQWPQPACLGIVTHGVVSRAILGHFLQLNEAQIRQVKHPNALFYELSFVDDEVEVRHYLADQSSQGNGFEHSGDAIDGICQELPPLAVSGE
ncbi:MAG: hypothetical protein GWP70_00535 [Proteobacteria bacterium]|nr:hypothetical protein [Pseudomonadota bacterium]